MMKKKRTPCLGIVIPKRLTMAFLMRKIVTILGCAGVLIMIVTVFFGQKIISSHFVRESVPETNVISMNQPNAGTDTDTASSTTLRPPPSFTTQSTASKPTDHLVQNHLNIAMKDLIVDNRPPLRPENIKVQVFPDWPQVKPKDNLFLLRVYIYSAFISLHPQPPSPPPLGTYVHIVAFQEGKYLLPLKCCLRLPGRRPILGPKTQVDFSKTRMNTIEPPPRKHSFQMGVVYSCHFLYSPQQLRLADVTITSTSCPEDTSEYLTIQEPELRPGSLGLCAKVLFGHELDPHRLVEWFEVQRLLGVDKVVLFDLDHSEMVDRVLRHYERTGLLTRLPYKLPDRPWGRDIRRGTNNDHFGDEQVLTTWDCRLRMAGYGFVLALDLDEVVIARKFLYLKPYLREEFRKRPELAAIFFRVQFFVEEWGPVDPSSPLHMLQYLNSTIPWEARFKYVYVPAKTHQPLTHHLMQFLGYSSKRAPPWTAILLHYRKCPFESCELARITDNILTRYSKTLVPRVLNTLRKVGLQ